MCEHNARSRGRKGCEGGQKGLFMRDRPRQLTSVDDGVWVGLIGWMID